MSMAAIKKRMRDCQRTLKRDIPATTRLELERRLKSLQSELADLNSQSHQMKMQQKYKYVRFVEKQKIDRKLKQEKDQDKIQEWQLKRLYVSHYPKDLKYISVLATELSPTAQERRLAILNYIKKRSEEKLSLESIVSSDIFTENAPEPEICTEKDDFFL
jgi:hypothetical protein